MDDSHQSEKMIQLGEQLALVEEERLAGKKDITVNELSHYLGRVIKDAKKK